MKKLFCLCAFLLMASFFAVAEKFHDISIDFPEGWETESNYMMVISRAPMESENDQFRENVTVVRELIGDEMTAEEYVIHARQLLSNALPGLEMIKTYDTAHLYALDIEGIIVIQLQQVYVTGGYAYVVTFCATEDTFESYSDDFALINSSVTFNE